MTLQCDGFPLSDQEAGRLWEETYKYRQFGDEAVTVRCVTEEEIAALNSKYRGKETPTNVLTFSYDAEHDVALCLAVARREAEERNVSLEEYMALLLVHAFLHATGMDHEKSSIAAEQTRVAEEVILQKAGFAKNSL